MTHRLDPLLRPRSIAVVGASAKPNTVGCYTFENLLAGQFNGELFAVNPAYDTLHGQTSYASITALPTVPDLAIFCVADKRIEALLNEAIATGVLAVSIMSSLVLDDDKDPVLKRRISRKIRDAGIVACGANGMGFYNVSDSTWACGFDGRQHVPPGKVALISHSGSGMCGIVDCDERLRFNLAVSTGNEIDATMDEYLDFALDIPDTRVVGLFIETARNPQGLCAAFQKANDKKIPIIALKVGRTKRSAALTISHSGAIAGDDASFDALFDRFGVQRVRDMDELATALILFSEWPLPGAGSLVSLHDSGGERQLMVDLADEHGVPLTELSKSTVDSLQKVLDPELPAVNPLDGWSRGGPDSDRNMTDCLSLLMQDDGAAAGVLMHDRAPDGRIYPAYLEYMRRAHTESGKPVALVSATQGTGSDSLVVQATHAGFPILDGVAGFLTAIRALFAWRDFLNLPDDVISVPDANVVTRWQKHLGLEEPISEDEAFAMFADFGIPSGNSIVAGTEREVLEAAESISFPVALKTAALGIPHKMDVGGVALGVNDETELREAYRAMAKRLGPDVLVAGMQESGVEMMLGAKRDPQFGPVVILGFGGIYSELLKDVVFALPPFGPTKARDLVSRLRMKTLLGGARGAAPAAVDAFCEMAANFSAMVYALKDDIREIDINPVIVQEKAAIAVDALIVRE